ncbi:transporter domain protein [Rhodococcus sp. MTM3W5.2]|uniref:hypothetical protein n=1 Tax=Rhodococcus sp. MTM3W5.2 TaxID=1805827 RepID=UPI0009793A1A|nr:hypothetical protein [Rhodococcus sp. MTM3W5.2]AQA24858.1 transporter domain protein [Rhodococcus sp. MTM3W5.2]
MLESPQPPLLERDRDGFSGREWAMLLVLCGAIFLEGVDVSMFGVALPSIRADLSMSTTELQWVISAYVLGYGGFMLLGAGRPTCLAVAGCSCCGSRCSSRSPVSGDSPPRAGS